LPRGVGKLPECDNTLNAPWEQRVEPPVSICGDDGVVLMSIPTALAKHTVDVRVLHHVAVSEPQLGEKTLHAMTRAAHESSSRDDFVLRRILADDQEPGRAIEATPVEHRSPFNAEVSLRKNGAVRHVSHEGAKRL
jgi:hypothetical protein